MNAAAEIVAELRARGVRAQARGGGGVRLVPARLIDPGLRNRIYAHKAEVIAQLRAEGGENEIEGHAAYSILESCRCHGVALRIDPQTGDLVIGRAGARADEPSQPWRSLLVEIEANLEPVARLVEAGWHLHATFPAQTAA